MNRLCHAYFNAIDRYYLHIIGAGAFVGGVALGGAAPSSNRIGNIAMGTVWGGMAGGLTPFLFPCAVIGAFSYGALHLKDTLGKKY